MKLSNWTLRTAIAMAIALGLSTVWIGCGDGETADHGAEPPRMEAPSDGGDAATPESDVEALSPDDSSATTADAPSAPVAPAGDNPGEPVTAAAQTGGIPRLVDLGSKQCIPCQMMAPILEELTEEYAGRMEIVFIDVWLPENEAVAEAFGITSIPTQIFYDGAGRELGRHVGFMSKEDILNMWQELGFDFS